MNSTHVASKVGLVSGGFHETVDRLAREAGIDYVKANHLEVIDGFLTGKVYGEIVYQRCQGS